MDNHLFFKAIHTHGETILPSYEVRDELTFFFIEKRNEKHWKKSERKKAKDSFLFYLRGRTVSRVYSQREYERNIYVYIRAFPAILYFVSHEVSFIFRERGVVGKNEEFKKTGARQCL